MLPFLATYVPTLLIMLAIDAAWLGLVALPLFRQSLGDLLTFRAAPGIAFYLLYTLGIMVFVTPAGRAGGLATIIWQGLLFGLVAYGTYELTNYATLKPWNLKLVLLDMAWGAVLTAIAATLGLKAGAFLGRFLG
jgi:uncharacterized membrane protein